MTTFDAADAPVPGQLELAGRCHAGTLRPALEDAWGSRVERDDCALVVVADGVSGQAGGAEASAMAVEVTLRAFSEAPPREPPGSRLYRAVQQANIEIYDRAVTVTELRGMSTTLTAVVVDAGELTAVHVGDSRLYLLRDGVLTQLTKDHTVAADKVRFGLLAREKARHHPDRSVLTRSVGRELIVSRDRLSRPVAQGDVLLVCSDGLHTVLGDEEMTALLDGRTAEDACCALVDAANARGTPDNLTAAVLRVLGPTPAPGARSGGLGARLRRVFQRPGGRAAGRAAAVTPRRRKHWPAGKAAHARGASAGAAG
ncbi:MAG TPA: protein phosphatase 2C domain-containing protein [Anaeromyxobacteraceae bacterium]|nr:protein phosphatase 2C domain-containing protein [Anaeromyxobacteraceae bacterium]